MYKGYRELVGDTDTINKYLNDPDFSDWTINEYLIIHDESTGVTSELRFNGTEFVPLRLPASKYIKAKNSQQRCALDILMNEDITATAIMGGYGSGKTFISMQMALYNTVEKGKQSKILGVREAKGEGASVGFLKGDFKDKTEMFFKPFEQQLDGGVFQLMELMQKGVLDTNIPYYMKGTTYENTIILVDEAEDLTESQIRLIGTRAGQNSKVIFSGDFAQAIGNKTESNPLVKMCEELRGNPRFACIYLEEDVRSETSKMFANLFKS